MKRILSVILCIALCLSLCACGKSEAVKSVESAIDAIGTVTLASGDAIAAAEEQYAALPAEEQGDVENLDDLEAARAAYNGLRVDETAGMIDSIGTVTADSGDAISAARASYDALPADLQDQVSNYDKLISSEKDYEYIIYVDANMVKSYRPIDADLANGFEYSVDQWNDDDLFRAALCVVFHLQGISDDLLDSEELHLGEQYFAIDESDNRIDLIAPYADGQVLIFQYWPNKGTAQIGYANTDLGILDYLKLLTEVGEIDTYVLIPLSAQMEVMNMIS